MTAFEWIDSAAPAWWDEEQQRWQDHSRPEPPPIPSSSGTWCVNCVENAHASRACDGCPLTPYQPKPVELVGARPRPRWFRFRQRIT